MQSNVRKSTESKESHLKKELIEERKTQDEKTSKKTVQAASTPRNFIKKPTASDVYSSSKTKSTVSGSVKAPKKVPSTTKTSLVSPMKDLLKSSPSTTSQVSVKTTRSSKSESLNRRTTSKVDSTHKSKEKDVTNHVALRKGTSGNLKNNITTPRTAKDLPFVNVTVNSPPTQRKHVDSVVNKVTKTDESEKSNEHFNIKTADNTNVRHRQKTRTLNESEVKVLTPDVVDNNFEMQNLTRKLSAKPKSFFVDLDERKAKLKAARPVPSDVLKSSDEENYSYEDDFESYESDFESYHSDNKSNDTRRSDTTDDDQEPLELNEQDGKSQNCVDKKTMSSDDERMLDSGSFELREAQKSANKIKPAIMDEIVEGSEDVHIGDDSKNKTSYTDEGFLELSSSSGVSSLRTIAHNEDIERPLFIDFKKSKENKKKRLINEQLRRRAEDLLSVIKLHEMSYSLFEMKPIPYDVYMTTFGRSNYVQTSVQTYDDGVDEEIQTEHVYLENKWTQNPVKFSRDEIYLNAGTTLLTNTRSVEDLMSKFTLLINDKSKDVEEKPDSQYKSNPLRIYFEQKDGVGKDSMLPVKDYKLKINNVEFDVVRLKMFLKKVESRVSDALTKNAGNAMHDFVKASNLSFSKGYKTLAIDANSFLRHRKVCGIISSDTRSNLIVTTHKKGSGVAADKSFICIWDVSAVDPAPLKLLVAIGDVTLGRLRGNTDGIFVGALEDGSIHLWDLSEEPTWRYVETSEHIEDVVDGNVNKTQTEIDREWNLKNSDVADDKCSEYVWRASAYTSSASYLQQGGYVDDIVGLEFTPQLSVVYQDGGRRIIAQICSLQRRGVLTIWTVIQEKNKGITPDLGKAYWSKMKLEKYQTISLVDHTDVSVGHCDGNVSFNLSVAKRRILNKRLEREFWKDRNKRRANRPKSGVTDAGVAIAKRVLPDEMDSPESWESGIVCNDLKIVCLDNVDHYLVARNCGQVLCCTRSIGYVKVKKVNVSHESSTVTTLATSPLQQVFLAGTDSGLVLVCCLRGARVLLALDCGRGPQPTPGERCLADNKGRFAGSAAAGAGRVGIQRESAQCGQLKVKTIQWSQWNPCCIFALTHDGVVSEWDLLQSDIHARGRSADGPGLRGVALGDDAHAPTMVVLTAEGQVQTHLLSAKRTKDQQGLFLKYISLL